MVNKIALLVDVNETQLRADALSVGELVDQLATTLSQLAPRGGLSVSVMYALRPDDAATASVLAVLESASQPIEVDGDDGEPALAAVLPLRPRTPC